MLWENVDFVFLMKAQVTRKRVILHKSFVVVIYTTAGNHPIGQRHLILSSIDANYKWPQNKIYSHVS